MSPILCSRMKSRTSKAPCRAKNSTNGPPDGFDRPRDTLLLGRFAMPLRLAHQERGQHRRKRERRAGQIGRAQSALAATTSAKAPAPAEPIRQPYCDMPDPTPSWRGSRSLDAISVDDDVEARARNADEDGGRDDACRCPAAGSASARFTTAAITATPVTSIHDTRWPSRPRIGSFTPSTIQAQRNLKLYARKTSVKAVIVDLSMPSCFRRVVSVAPIIA